MRAASLAILVSYITLVYSLPGPTDVKVNTASEALKTIYQLNSDAWIENLRVRSNGKILATRFDNHPKVYEFDPKCPSASPKVLAEFPQFTRDKGLSGITEVSDDVFAFIATPTRYDLRNHSLVLRGGPTDIFTIDLNAASPKAKHLTTFHAGFANGFSALPGTDFALISDSLAGVIYRLNVSSGETDIVIDNKRLRFPEDADLMIGINGIQINDKGTVAYFANSAKGFVASVQINPKTGLKSGKFDILARKMGVFDDFAVTPDALYVTTDPEGELYRLSLKSKKLDKILGSPESAKLAGATAAQFGRSAKTENKLYLTTNGGLAIVPYDPSFVQPGGLKVLDLDKL